MLEVADGADRARAEQLKAPHVDAGEQDDGQPGVHLHQEGRDEGHAEIDLARSEGRVRVDTADVDVCEVGEALGQQQSSAMYCRAMQIPGMRVIRSLVVSGGAAVADLGCRLRSPAVPHSVTPPRNLRRFICLACWVTHGNPLQP